MDSSISGVWTSALMSIVRGDRVTTAVIAGSAGSRPARFGRPVLSLTAIPATGVVGVPGQAAILNVTVLELPPAGVAIS
jgi:hypothetical protein